MNWIGEWCYNRCKLQYRDCEKCSRYCEPRYELAEAIGCSEYLIWMLINERGAITHPEFADMLADYLGASSEQRDSIVHEKHRGTYVPGKHVRKKRRSPTAQRSVVKIDREGNVLAQYGTVQAAAADTPLSVAAVSQRCNSRGYVNEFAVLDYSFRFADGWLQLDDKVRREKLKSYKERYV